MLSQRQVGAPNPNASLLWARHNTKNDESNESTNESAAAIKNQDQDEDDQSLNEDKTQDNSTTVATSNALKQMEQMMGRNYSDFMRSLAAKYNQNKDTQNGENSAAASPFLMSGHPFPLAAAAAAAAGIPVSLPAPTSAVVSKEKPNLPLPGYPFPFFRPQNNVMNQVTQTQALINMMRNVQQQKDQQQAQQQLKRPASRKDDLILDLSAESAPAKRIRRSSDTTDSNTPNVSLCNLVSPCSHEAKEVKTWNVDDVCKFVASVELCQPFVEHFRTQGIDGKALILLKEDHLLTTMKMRLGSVLKFKAELAKKMGSCPICLHCVHCHNELTNETKETKAPVPSTNTEIESNL